MCRSVPQRFRSRGGGGSAAGCAGRKRAARLEARSSLCCSVKSDRPDRGSTSDRRSDSASAPFPESRVFHELFVDLPRPSALDATSRRQRRCRPVDLDGADPRMVRPLCDRGLDRDHRCEVARPGMSRDSVDGLEAAIRSGSSRRTCERPRWVESGRSPRPQKRADMSSPCKKRTVPRLAGALFSSDRPHRVQRRGPAFGSGLMDAQNERRRRDG